MPESLTGAPRTRPSLRWLAVLIGALAGAVTALSATAPSAASNAVAATPVFTVTPAPLDFGAQVVNTTSADKSLTITNSSGAPQVLQPLVFVQNDFREVTSNCPDRAKNFLLAAGASCTASFNFTPYATGTRSINVTMTLTPDGLPGQTLTLTGTGINPGAQPGVITQPYICGGGVCSLGTHIAGNFFATQLFATGGTAPYTWSGQPAGMTIQPDGSIAGTPHNSTFTVTVTDTTGASATATFSITVTGHLECNTAKAKGNMTAALSGPTLNGQTPSGTATLTNDDGNGDCATSLLTQVSDVNLPDSTQLWVTYDTTPVGTITLNGGSGTMTPFAYPRTGGINQVAIFTSFPGNGQFPVNGITAFPLNGAQPILQSGGF